MNTKSFNILEVENGNIVQVHRLKDDKIFKIGDLVRLSDGTCDTIKAFNYYHNDKMPFITVSLNPKFDAAYRNGTGVNLQMIEFTSDEYEKGYAAGYNAAFLKMQELINQI